MTKEMDRIYSNAREAGAEAESIAKVNVKYLTRDQLEAEYVSLCGMVAYYGKLERDQIGNPIRFFGDIRKWFRAGEVQQIMSEENPERIAALLVKNKDAILQVFAVMDLMLDEFTDRPAEADGTQP